MEKYKQYNKPLHMCFIDIQKAYDSVNRDLLWKICKSYGLTDKFVNLLKVLRNNSKAKVRINGQLSNSFDIKTGVMQGEIPSPFLFDIFFDFIIRRVLDEAGIGGIKLACSSSDFYHWKSEKYDLFNILVLMHADDLMALCNSLQDLEKFILTFEIVTQKYGLTTSVKETVIMSMEEFETDSSGKVMKQNEIHHPDANIVIRNQKVEITDKFTYLSCGVFRDQKMDMELESRIIKATAAFNMLRNVIWHRKTVSINSKLKIFRACVLPVLFYGSETWYPTVAQDKRINAFYMKCLRTLVRLNLGNRVPNQTNLQLTGQPAVEDIMIRNRLGWFGHVNRMENNQGKASLSKKVMFSYFPNWKRPGNVRIRKKWEVKVTNDLETCNVKTWRRETKDRDLWRETINAKVKTTSANPKTKQIVQDYKMRTEERRSNEKTADQSKAPRKVVEVLVKNSNNNNMYTCPNCKKKFKPQRITGYVRSCAKAWCKKNNIEMGRK